MRLMTTVLLALAALPLAAQDPNKQPAPPSENWNLYWQATTVGQMHPPFSSPYQGPLSLLPHFEADVSLTSTVFFGWRPFRNTQVYINPELAGGRGFSDTNGIANFPNGEITRVAAARPTPYVARAYVTQDFGFGEEREVITSDENRLAGTRPMTRYSITIGRFSAADFFDDNRYSHDPRTQFLGWATMYNGAWDYPADVRGYTVGWFHEFHTRRWSLRYGSFAMPKIANGARLDYRVFRDHGNIFEGEIRGKLRGYDGAIRLMSYQNRANAGTYAVAIAEAPPGVAPDVKATRKVGTLKYGFGVSADQQLTKNTGVFMRLGWNDGKTESFAFTAMDRLASGGVSIAGARWKRPDDTLASAVTVGGLAGVHAVYLQKGGLDFLIGDGTLTYGPEVVAETYYSAQVVDGFFATLDIQHINNPAYNRDRGPVWAFQLRLHTEFGKHK
jgi:high affinity Mn2+ porin